MRSWDVEAIVYAVGRARECGWTIARGAFVDRIERCCCPLYAFLMFPPYYGLTVELDTVELYDVAAASVLGVAEIEVEAFTRAFDAFPAELGDDDRDVAEYDDAIAAGQEVARRIFHT